jgi:uncharacterized membrane protein YbaN (DUF454 family)
LIRLFLIAFGSLNVALGVIGIFVPLMPTTIFFIIAAGCYVKSSPALYNKLISHPTYGPIILNYREHRAMPLKAKKRSILVLWVTLSISALMISKFWVHAILLTVGIGVSTIILRLKTLENLNLPDDSTDSQV